MHSAYIKTAFLDADLEEEIYMRQPIGAHERTPRIMRRLKSMFGLKQASREWNKLFHHTLSSLGLKRATSGTGLCTINSIVMAYASYLYM
jgi:hypothetical protein